MFSDIAISFILIATSLASNITRRYHNKFRISTLAQYDTTAAAFASMDYMAISTRRERLQSLSNIKTPAVLGMI